MIALPPILKPPPPVHRAIASYYDDSGQTASGRHYTYGFASLMFGSQWGKRIQFCYRRCVTGSMDDHGPYVSGRLFDFNVTLKEAIGCTDLCYVHWSYPQPARWTIDPVVFK